MFKQIFYKQKPTQYIICDDGVIYNTTTHRNLYGSKSNGYIYVQLTIDGKSIDFALHRLLAEYFIENPEHKEVVHHIDGNQLNNKLDNLMWLTQRENSLIKINFNIEINYNFPQITEEELDAEEWRPFRDTQYLISSLGRYKNIKTNRISSGSINKNNGYVRWAFKNYEVQAHRAVYEVFHPNEVIKVINHIDGNRANNKLSNLENITQSENVMKSYYETKTKKTTCVAQYALNNKLIAVYPSMAEASRCLKVANTSVVRNAILNHFSCQGFKLKEITKEEYQQLKLELMHVT